MLFNKVVKFLNIGLLIANLVFSGIAKSAVPAVVIQQQLNQYYQIKERSPLDAKNLLIQILQEDPNNTTAQAEMGYALLKENKAMQALTYFKLVAKVRPHDANIAHQIQYIENAARPTTTVADLSTDANAFLNQYYQFKKNDPNAAQTLLKNNIGKYSDNATVQAEIGYNYLSQKKYEDALPFFISASQLRPNDATLKMQIKYIQDYLKPKQIVATTIDPMDQYYQLKKKDPKEAQVLLTKIIQQDPNNGVAQAEMGYLLFSQKQLSAALSHFRITEKINPHFNLIKKQIKSIEDSLKGVVAKAAKPISELDNLLNQFYQSKDKNPNKAEMVLHLLISKYPNNIKIQKEAGIFYLNKRKPDIAMNYFLEVERLSPTDYDNDLQLGYIYNELGNQRKAYHYFSKATASNDAKIKHDANQSMTNLSGTQTKLFPNPWFADIYLSPFYYSRFNLMVYPGQARFGRTFGKNNQWVAYTGIRATKDNKSNGGSTFQIPQIFEDNAAIYALGLQYFPFIQQAPGLSFYLERGIAESLIPNNPNCGGKTWCQDLRGGVNYQNSRGATPIYSDVLIFPMAYVANFYGNISYYSRYNDNVIGFLSAKEGVRVANFGPSSLDFYLRMRGGFDTNREFYNNFVEVGPGIEFIPNNRYNVSLRFEMLEGYYIKVNSPSPNPYPPHYRNNLSLLEFYMKI